MLSTLKNNAYHILGLDTSSSERDMLKRSKEIINRLRADDTPVYDSDIGLFEDFRTEDMVKDALQRLQSPKKRIKEYFFWFQVADSVDDQAMGQFKVRDFSGAIHTWQDASDGQGAKALFYKKNLAILYCLVLSANNDKGYLQNSLALWKDLINSDKFWASFTKVYRLHDEQTASEDVVSDFKVHVVEYLADIYTELHQIHKDSDYIHEFQKIFSAKGEKIEKSVLAPAYEAISRAVEGLEVMEVSKDGSFDKKEAGMIQQLVATVQQELNKLIDLGLYNDSQTKIMRDRSANALRSIALDLHNNLSELGKAQGLHEIAIQLAGTDSLKNKLQTELDQIQKNIKDDEENCIVIKLSSYGGVTVVLKSSYIESGNKRIFYKDARSISYHAQSRSVNFIPISQNYNYTVASDNETITFSLDSSLHIGEQEHKEAWGRLVGLSEKLIEPHIVRWLVDRIFDRDEVVKIGHIEFSKQGYSKNKFKLFGEPEREMVYWTDTVYVPQLHSGVVTLWKDKDGKNQQFDTLDMSTPNAVVLPELVQACVTRAQTP